MMPDERRREPVVDCLVHPFPESDEQFATYLGPPIGLRPRAFGSFFNRGILSPPFAEYRADTVEDGEVPGSNRDLLVRQLADASVDVGVLVPLTKGLVPDVRKAAAIASATNQWLAENWLSDGDDRVRLYGAIRVAARNPRAAVAEIEKWADDDRFIQVSVSLEAMAPYGQETYFPIWEAAAKAHLPVVVVSDRARGIGFPLTPLGNPPQYVEAVCQVPASAALHLASLITEGVFDRLTDLQFVFGDGSFDAITILHWRVTNDWRGGRSDVPWVSRAPIDYLEEHVHFVIHPTDGPASAEESGRLVELLGLEKRLVFGSRWPYWDKLDSDDVRDMLPESLHAPVLGGNAAQLYSLNEIGVL